ncbi:MAG: type II toxin-antitoxin system VapC family toxin [Pyrinomonadaceae bacterium]
MRLLLDTCIVYDWLMGEIKDAETKALIRTEDAYVSPISVWEMALKHRIGKLSLPTTEVESAISGQGFAWLAVQPSHSQALFALPSLHRDPFDLLLIAQAKAEDMRVVTHDPIFARYLPDTIIPRK